MKRITLIAIALLIVVPGYLFSQNFAVDIGKH